MMHRHVAIARGISALLMASLAWQFFPAHASKSLMSEDQSRNPNQQALSTNQIFLPLVLKNYFAPAPLWRFGIAKTRHGLISYDSYGISSMRFGWYVDFQANAGFTTPYGIEYVPTVRIKQDKLAVDGITITNCRVGLHYAASSSYSVSPNIDTIRSIATSRPGLTWLIGNEMERIDWANSDGSCGRQDEILPELYAQAYHDLYTAIKSADPTAQVAIGGMVEFTDLRRQYLDRVWAEYIRLSILNSWDSPTMPVDIWNTHVYMLPETSCVAFPENCWGADIPAGFSEASGASYTVLDNKDFTKAWAEIVALRTWMKDHGQQDKPLIITEYGVNMPVWIECPAYPDTSGCPFTPEEVRDKYMVPSFDSFLNQTDATIGFPADGNRLVQRWNWWSADYDDGYCDSGVFYEYYNGSLFYSGLGPSSPPTDCAFPAQGMSSLGTYWKQYVQNLPIGSGKPYP